MVTYLRTAPRSERRFISRAIRAERLADADPRSAVRNPRLPKPRFSVKTGEYTGSSDDYNKLTRALESLRKGKLPNYKPLLPLLFSLRKKPYSIDDHFPFEPFYTTTLPATTVWMAARQTSKSTNQAVNGIMLSIQIPFFNTLFVTPQFELVRRFSQNYVRPFIDDSPFRTVFQDTHTARNVLQRSFSNGSTMFFSFAFNDCDRTRGINADKNGFDEAQDLDPDFIPIIFETTSASSWKIKQITGTPKTFSGAMQKNYELSSQAEWVTKCRACNHWNIPSFDFDLDAMMGPMVLPPGRKISEETPGVVCAKCGRPINPREGHYAHRFPDLRNDFPGFHVPQCILPMHYARGKAWRILLGKRRGEERVTPAMFYNEVCSTSYDQGVKLLSQSDLKAAATLHENTLQAATKVNLNRYKQRIIGVDWGGGGKKRTSFTCVAVVGVLPNGKFEVIYGWRSLNPHDRIQETRVLLTLMKLFRCSHIAHDFGGAGESREALMYAFGVPANRFLPFSYQRATSGPMIRAVPYNDYNGKRSYFQLDKPNSLYYTCQLIANGWVKFFRYEPGLLNDFLALTEDRIESTTGSEIYTIIRDEHAGPDDFAHAVNYAVMASLHRRRKLPDLTKVVNQHLTPEMLQKINPVAGLDWESLGPKELAGLN